MVRLSVPGPGLERTLTSMNDAPDTRLASAERMRIARLLEAHGDAIGAILAYGDVIRDGAEPAATEARLRIGGLARRAWPATPA
jgi:hypothetical protein